MARALCSLLALIFFGQSMPAWAQGKPSATMKAGKVVYAQYCLTCHQADGSGVPSLNPPVSASRWVQGPKPRLISVILKGMRGQEVDGEAYHNLMPAHSFLSDAQIAGLLTYLRASFGNKASPVTVVEVKAARSAK